MKIRLLCLAVTAVFVQSLVTNAMFADDVRSAGSICLRADLRSEVSCLPVGGQPADTRLEVVEPRSVLVRLCEVRATDAGQKVIAKLGKDTVSIVVEPITNSVWIVGDPTKVRRANQILDKLDKKPK